MLDDLRSGPAFGLAALGTLDWRRDLARVGCFAELGVLQSEKLEALRPPIKCTWIEAEIIIVVFHAPKIPVRSVPSFIGLVRSIPGIFR